MDLTNKDTIQSLLFTFNTGTNKEYGQNFLIDRKVINHLIESANLSPEDYVIEVGPGIGTLTTEIAQRVKQVFAFEIDRSKVPLLNHTLKKYTNIRLINEDILSQNISEFLLENSISRYKFISSLPYNIAKKVIKNFLECSIKPEIMSLIIQKEVGEDYVPVNDSQQTFLSNYLKLYGTGVILDRFGPASFSPAPKVDSCILVITPNQEKNPDQKLVKFIKMGFANPRKKLVNTLSSSLKVNSGKIEQILAEAGIEITVRAHELNTEQWKSIFYLIQDDK